MTDAPFADRFAVVGDFAAAIAVLDAGTPISRPESWLGDHPRTPAVVFPHSGGYRLIGRANLDDQLRGRLGFGAALLRHKTLAELESEPALAMPPDIAADEAVRVALTRAERMRYSPVLVVAGDGSLALAPVGRLLEYLADRYSLLAATDELTGLGNRRAFTTAAEAALSTSGPVALFLFDLDRFKEINDALGHQVGDLLLREVGETLRRASGDTAPVFRFGGDEFAVLISEFRRPFPEAVARLPFEERVNWIGQQIVREVRGPYEIGGVSITAEASIGMSYSPDHGSDLSTLLSRADAAMYAAKRDRVGAQLWQPEIAMASSSDLRLLAELRDGIRTGQLRLHYQPLVDASSGTIRGVEALVRWQHPSRGLLSPGAFVPQAERSEAIVELTDWVLAEAISQAARWHAGGTPLPVSVNLAAPALAHDRIVETITALLEAHRLPAHLLVGEVTESAVMTRPEETLRRLRALDATGVRIAMDDFGTGNTSLALLTRLPLHELKLDRSFIVAMSDHRGYAIVEAVAQLSRRLGLVLVGEGIEDATTADALAGLGFDLLQGFYFSRPVPAELIEVPRPADSVSVG